MLSAHLARLGTRAHHQASLSFILKRWPRLRRFPKCETEAAALPSPQPLLRAAVGETDKGEEQLTPEQNAVVLTRSRKT